MWGLEKVVSLVKLQNLSTYCIILVIQMVEMSVIEVDLQSLNKQRTAWQNLKRVKAD